MLGAFVASADVEGASDCIKHDDVEWALLQKGVHPESVCSLSRECCELKGRVNLLAAPCTLLFCVLVAECDMWNQVWDNALRELAGC